MESDVAGPSDGDFEVQTGDGFAVLRPRGDLDLDNAGACRDRLVELVSERALVVVDLDGLDYIDSSGLGALMMAHRFATGRGRRLAIVCTAPRFRRSFELRGINLAIPLYSSIDEVLEDQLDAPDT